MKILSSALLFTITVLHNFDKLSASDRGKGSSLPRGSQHPHTSWRPYPKPLVQVPHPSGSQHPHPPDQRHHPSGSQDPHPPAQHPPPSNSQYPHEEDTNLDPPTNTYPYRNRIIAVWRYLNTKNATKARLLGPNTIPDIFYKNSHNYISRAEYFDDVRVIVYIENDKVIGAELPPRTSGPTPHKSIWYINYFREGFRVKVNPQTGAVISVTLQQGNFFPPKAYRERFRIETVPVFFGGIRFFVDLEPQSNGKRIILGAFLNPRED